MRRWTSVFLATILVPTLHSQTPLFTTSSTFVGTGSGQVVLTDINLDGRIDMITRHLLEHRVRTFWGDGRGGFSPASGGDVDLAYPPGRIVVADFNRDRRPDLVVSRSDRDAVDVFLGDAGGAFNRVANSPFTASASTESFTRDLDVVDVNEDGNVDLVTSHGRRNTLSVLLGDGTGGFTAAAPIELGIDNGGLHFVDFADMDGDGHADIIVAHTGPDAEFGPGGVVVLGGDGSGTFRNARRIAAGSIPDPPHNLTVADINGDGRLDIVVAHANRISILSSADGKLETVYGSPFNVGNDVYGVAAGDMNGDGNTDLVAATIDSVTLLLADGRTLRPADGSPYRAGPGAYKVTVGDVNGDGKPDVAASAFEGTTVTLLLSTR